jgi:hypothetical protein
MKYLAQILIACTFVEALQSLRPGAEWTVVNDSYTALQWLDQTQTRPTNAQMLTEIQNCKVAAAARAAAKAQARLDVKNTTLTQAQRLSALLILLDYDQ